MKALNKAKAVFVSMYLTVGMLISAYSVYMLSLTGFHVGWLGAILANAPIVLYVGWLMGFKPTARTEYRLSRILYLALVGVAAAAWKAYQSDGAEFPPLAAAVVGLLGYVVYDYWYAIFDRSGGRDLAVGTVIPAFEVADAEGNAVPSSSFFGSAALMMFYRGNWCPLCMAQIKEITGQYRELADRGVTVALISPQPPGKTKNLAGKFDVPFRFLVDPGNRAAETLGIASPGGLPFGMEVFGYDGDTVLPTVIMTDAEGRITFVDQTENYRVRPDPARFLAVLESNSTEP